MAEGAAGAAAAMDRPFSCSALTRFSAAAVPPLPRLRRSAFKPWTFALMAVVARRGAGVGGSGGDRRNKMHKVLRAARAVLLSNGSSMIVCPELSQFSPLIMAKVDQRHLCTEP